MALVEPEFAQPEVPEGVVALAEISAHHNLAEVLPEERLARICHDVMAEYSLDKTSMAEWFDLMQRGLDLAKLIKKDKTTPWPNAANVKFPLVTSAALQFNARAYPAIVPGGNPVLPKVFGDDQTGQKAARGERVAEHMSWQLTSKVPEWETETDSLLTVLPLVGTMLRKVWYDPTLGRIRVKLCEPGAIIINDKVKALDVAPRVSEEIKLYPYEIEERKRAGVFRDVDLKGGESDDEDAPQKFIEQHRRIDLDEDGYPEPYVVTVHEASSQVVRIVANFEMDDVAWNGRVVSIQRRDHYVVYHFLPSLDGGFWGTGLGLLLGDITETVNSLINMILDSGHLSSLGAGFIGAKDFRMNGGAARFKPGEWKQVSAGGADIRQAMVPLQFPQPSPVLFQMLGLLIEAGREIASVKDVMTGDAGGRQQTATTTLALIEQGMMVFTAAYKRIYRALKDEFQMIARINAETVTDEEYSAFHDLADPQTGQPVMISAAQDYDLSDMDIAPVADPRIVTSMQAMGRAQLLMEFGQQGVVDPQKAAMRALEAAQVEDIEDLMPQPDPMQAQLQQAQVAHGLFMMEQERAKAQVETAKLLAEIEKLQADAQATLEDVETDRIGLALQNAKDNLNRLMEMAKHVDERSAGGMAGQPDNPAFAGQPAAGGAPATGVALESLLAGGGSPYVGEGNGDGGFGYPV